MRAGIIKLHECILAFRLRSDINFHFRAARSVIAPRYAQQVPSEMTALRQPLQETKAQLGPDQMAMQAP